jgi:site-specific DNA recombinase
MKKAIGYARISDFDQSNWSIGGQQDLIKDYCRKNDIELVAIFTDEGQSAKNFDRSDWKELEKFVRKNFDNVDYLLVMAWTRFSRNTAEALQMIEQLEKKFSIRVISINEPIHLHPDSPFFHYIRSQIIQNGELELRINRDRTRFGIHQAQRAGRYLGQAPIGYLNSRDGSNLPIIIIDKLKGHFIAEAYSRFLNHETMATIRSFLKKNNIEIRGNSYIRTILQNPVYMGYVKKISYYDDPEMLVKGIHEPIVNSDTWWKVQAIFNQKIKPGRTIISEDFPLRGVLKCFCQRTYTGAFSKGRKMVVPYYKCNSHTSINLNANKIHKQFNELLKELSLPASHVQYLQEKILDNLNNELADRSQQVCAIRLQLAGVEKKISGLEEKYFLNKVDDATYSKWKANYHTEISSFKDQLNDLQEPVDQVWKRYNESLGKLCDLHWVYNSSTVEDKQAFVRLVFNNSLYYQENIYRTTFLMDLFKPKALILKEKRLLIYEQPPLENVDFDMCAPKGNIIEPIYKLLAVLENMNLKTA